MLTFQVKIGIIILVNLQFKGGAIMLEKFKPLATSLIGMQPLWLGMSEQDPLYNYYVLDIETSSGKSVLLGLSDKTERSAICYQSDSNLNTIDNIYSVSLFGENFDEKVYCYDEKWFYAKSVLINGSVSIQLHWSLETSELNIVLAKLLISQMLFIYLSGEEETDHINNLIPNIPETLIGQTDILGIPLEWKKEDAKQCAEKVIQTVFYRATALISLVPSS